MTGDDGNFRMNTQRVEGYELSNIQNEAPGPKTFFVLGVQAAFRNYSVLFLYISFISNQNH
jgi:hypothetical protein